jgi:hypothetical protein
VSRLAPIPEHHTLQLLYLPRDFLADRVGRFFSWANDEVSTTGRN